MPSGGQVMIDFAKSSIKALLRACNRKLVYVPGGTIWGGDLREDLRVAVRGRRPTCLDVGANVGQSTALFQELFGQPLIHAFEPSRKAFAQLQTKSRKGSVSLHNCAMGREASDREFINYAGSTLSSFLPLDGHAENRFRDVAVESRESVAVDTIDGFLAREGIEVVDLLKVDTQGFDLEVLAGAGRSLADGVVRNVLVELNFVRMYEGQASGASIIDFLAGHGLFLVDLYEKERLNLTIAWCTALFSRR